MGAKPEALIDPGVETKIEAPKVLLQKDLVKAVRCGKIVINIESGQYPKVVITGTVLGRDIDMLQLALTRQYMKYRQALGKA